MSNHPINTLQQLARIHLKPEEIESLGKDLDKVFSWISQLDSLCVRGIPHENDRIMPLRQDVLTDGNQEESIMRNAPAAQGSFFTVPKVLKS